MHLFRFAASSLVLSMVACSVSSEGTSSEDTAEVVQGGYRVTLATPGPVTAGTTPELAIKVLGPGGRPVKEFDDLHTQNMHVVGVSSDLQDFFHIHPTLAPDGTLTVAAPIGRAQPYNIFFEYDPKGDDASQLSRSVLLPVDAQAVAPSLATSAAIFDGSRLRSTTAGGARFELQAQAHGMIMTGMTTTFRVAIKTAAGAPVTDLTEWLGMPGHAIVLSEDASTFIHAHAMAPDSGGMGHAGMPGMDMGGMAMGEGGGHGGHGGHGGSSGGTPAVTPSVLDIDVNLPKAGLYKIFVQVKRGEDVLTAPFVIKAQTM